jgi:hypothetical protein
LGAKVEGGLGVLGFGWFFFFLEMLREPDVRFGLDGCVETAEGIGSAKSEVHGEDG